MPRIVMAAGALLALALTLGSASAQNPGCQLCAARDSVRACVACVREEFPGKQTEAEAQNYCTINQPICMKRLNKK